MDACAVAHTGVPVSSAAVAWRDHHSLVGTLMSSDARQVKVMHMPLRPIRLWQHGRAVRQTLRAYPPGTDALIDQIRSAGSLVRFVALNIIVPLYFAREQGWAVRGAHGEMAAIMYLRRGEREGIRVMHIDDISVDARYRRLGLGRRLMELAEELARKERRPFLKLAVTSANTPAITLYRQLGYDDRARRNRYFTCTLPVSPLRTPLPPDLTLRPLHRRQAAHVLQRFYELELVASVSTLAPLLRAYYPLHVRKGTKRMYAIERGGQQVGYADAQRQGGQWNLDLALRPELWGSDVERDAIHLLTSVIGPEAIRRGEGTLIALHLPCAAHFDALCAGPSSLASELGLSERSYERIVMVKALETLEA